MSTIKSAVTSATKAIKPIKISRTKAIELIQTAKGQIFNVTFTKKDGTKRNMTARKKLNSSATGVASTGALSAQGYLTRYDMFAKDWRAIDTRTISDLKLGGKVYKVA